MMVTNTDLMFKKYNCLASEDSVLNKLKDSGENFIDNWLIYESIDIGNLSKRVDKALELYRGEINITGAVDK